MRSTPTTIRTSSRSGLSFRKSRRSCGSWIAAASCSASVGSTTRSTTSAVPSTVDGQAICASRSSRSAAAGRFSCSIMVRACGSCRASASAASSSTSASAGSCSRAAAVRTRAKIPTGASQPRWAACSSSSMTARARAVRRGEPSPEPGRWSGELPVVPVVSVVSVIPVTLGIPLRGVDVVVGLGSGRPRPRAQRVMTAHGASPERVLWARRDLWDDGRVRRPRRRSPSARVRAHLERHGA